ncbi:MAG: dTDP-4-dehydrorhamnose 3,5-epimerase family protein, partial [Proteobacteria bacterium]|nr:dTDP-4-dehydrorhamnose 3,5-epimerase family protein [Pseudomonadota bacterium]
MTITPLTIPDVLLFSPKVWRDARGFFFESFRQDTFAQATGHAQP